MAKNRISLAVRSSVGVELWNSPEFKTPYTQDELFARDESKFCRTIVFSPDGKFVSWCNGTKVQICKTLDWKVICSLPRPKAFSVKFSPKGTYLMTCEMFYTNKDNPEGSPNLYIYKTENGEELFSTIQKKQIDWEPWWTYDETTFGIMTGGEVLFYDINSETGVEKPAKTLGGGRNGKFSISSGNKSFVAFYVPGAKGAPSMCKLYQYPNLAQNQAIASKSFFQTDKVEMLWNKRGTDLLILTSQEVDQTGASYYGKQALHYMSTKGDSYAVVLSKEGPIHAVEWSPLSNEFCVIYGYMPSKATIFNLKCDSVFDFGIGSRNSIYYNPFGNILLIAGFGNLRGNVEVWDLPKKKQITTLQASDSTMLEWAPSGDIFVTATTAPRLRMSNGFKVFHYSGALLHETDWPNGQELFEVNWQKFADGTFKEPVISNEKIEGLKSSQPQASTTAYRPPNIRGGEPVTTTSLHENDDEIGKSRIPGLPPGMTSSKSRGNPMYPRRSEVRGRGRGRGDTRKRTTTDENTTQSDINATTTGTDPLSNGARERWPQKPRTNNRNQGGNKIGTGDPEKDKRVKVINQKLRDIAKLKGKKDRGELLEVNQISKIAAETELINELKKLTVASSS